jgi:MFS family permease
MVFAVMSLTQLAAAPLFGRLSDRVGRKMLVTVGFALASLMLLLYFFVETSFQLILVSIGVSVFLSVSPLLLAMLFDATPGRLRGMSMGVYGSFEDMGIMIGPPLYGLIWSIYAPGFAFVAGAAFQSLSILLIHVIYVEQERD